MKLDHKDDTRRDLDCSNERLEAEISAGLLPLTNAKIAYRQMRALERLTEAVEKHAASGAPMISLAVPAATEIHDANDPEPANDPDNAAPSEEPAPPRRVRRA